MRRELGNDQTAGFSEKPDGGLTSKLSIVVGTQKGFSAAGAPQ
jgi:hypothetical protein